ncbi:carbohydrate ABC transporter permease [Paenibacillus sp. MER TA 81-3]|uniref:carbohydrate ABC transporter permease n=1 Tax=Paenibacillus sp. MER TA 81-3 TaxID=2939573 RepID=UPI00203AB1C5|nr:carbohydrate ABC transporter permease [Paenibacillus sp. MER TA 81-3]MCM3339072.1 carbohydrate ABC transporter permease [Paenibacillus sp. MER TA 81-3]
MRNKFSFGKFMGNLPVRILLLLYSLAVLYPLFWTVTTSFKTTEEFYENPWSLPSSISFANYVNAFEKASIGHYFMNSVFVTVISVTLCVFVSFMAAYAIARSKSRAMHWLRNAYMSALFIPSAFMIVPLFLLLGKIHLLDSLWGLIIVYASVNIPYTIFLLIGFMSSIPKEYEEAASIDGCSNTKILFQIIGPMAKSSLITVIIFNFMAAWNEYIMALSFITTETKRTLQLGLVYLMEVQRFSTDWGALFAGLVIVMVPTIAAYSLLQRQMTAGISMGGLKG